MIRFAEKIQKYCQEHTSPPSPLLLELERETHLKTLAPQMITGHLQGRLLEFFSRMLRPARILEIGTFTAYGTICLASGLREGGQIDTIEVNPELEWLIRKYLEKAGIQEKVRLMIGNARVLVPDLPGPYDLVFVDAGKRDNRFFCREAIRLLHPGGFLLVDNVLWSGKVLDKKPDADTRSIMAFNRELADDPGLETLMLPVRDGLFVARKSEG